MHKLTLTLCAFVVIAAGLPLINSTAWWIRIFDFPRLQIAVLTLIVIILAVYFVEYKWSYKAPLLLLLTATLVYQAQFVMVYTPLYKTQAKDSTKETPENSF